MTSRAANLVPAALSIEPRAGILDLAMGLAVEPGPGCEAPAALIASWLAADLAGAAPGQGGGPVLALVLDPGLVLPFPAGASLEARKEAYRLELGPGGGRLVAPGVEGLFRGAASLRQLVLSAASPGGAMAAIEACLIEDCPRFAWRGLMLDTVRNFFSVDFIERLLDLSALHRLNVFHWHLSDDQGWRLDLPGLPELALAGSRRLDGRFNVESWKEGCYSPQDVRRVVAFAAARGITVVPEIETPGHAVAILASHPELSCSAAMAAAAAEKAPSFRPEDRYGVFEDILCAGNDEVFSLLEKVFGGVADLFPGPYVHAGGDEAPKARWRDCPRCAKRLSSLGLGGAEADLEALQAWFMGRVGAILASRGKVMLGWDEILDGEGPSGVAIPEDAIVLSWRGYEGGARGAKRGHRVVMCPQTKACYLDHKQVDRDGEAGQLGVCTLRDSLAFEPVPPGLSPSEEALILGGQANLWTELMYFDAQVEYMAFPRLCAVSEALWRPRERPNAADFEARLGTHKARLDRLGVNYFKGPSA